MTTWKQFYAKEISLVDFLGNLKTHADFLESILEEKPKRTLKDVGNERLLSKREWENILEKIS